MADEPDNELLRAAMLASQIIGTVGADTLTGTRLGYVIRGRAGDDRIVAGARNDTVYGNNGNDRLFGGNGDDILYGQAGNDTLVGGKGADTLFGGNGNDVLVLGPQGGVVHGGQGSDILAFRFHGTINVTGGPNLYSIAGPDGFSASVRGIESLRLSNGTLTPLQAGVFVVCFAEGTRLLADRGEIAVEKLRAGDLLAAVSGRGAPLQPVLFVGRRRILLAGHPDAGNLAPVRIRAGALAEDTPHRDLLVSPDHCLFLDGALVPARLLVNGTTITVEHDLAEVTYYHVELPAHDVVIAEGAPAESWLDAGNRAWFENAHVAHLRVDATLEAYATTEATPCAPVLQGGARLGALRDALRLRALEIGVERVPASAA